MSNPNNQISSEFKESISSEYTNTMQEHGLKFEEQIPLITILHIGIPDFGRLWIGIRKTPGIILLIARLVSLFAFSILAVFTFLTNPQGIFLSINPISSLQVFLQNPSSVALLTLLSQYILIPIGLISGSVCFLIMDIIFLWARKKGDFGNVGYWFVITTGIILLINPIIVIPTEILLAGFLLIEPVELWAPLAMGSGLVFGVNLIVSVIILRTILSHINPDILLIESKYIAIRKCIREVAVSKPLGLNKVRIPIKSNAIARLTLSVYTKFILLGIVLFSLDIAISYLPIELISPDILVLFVFTIVSIVTIFVSTYLQIYRLKQGRIVAKTVLESIIVLAVFLSISVLLSTVALLELLIVFAVSFAFLIFAMREINRVAESNPEIMGRYYFEQLLQTLSTEDAEEFVQNGLDELRFVLEELNSSN